MNHFEQNLKKLSDEFQNRLAPGSVKTEFAMAISSVLSSIGARKALEGFKSLHEHEIGECLGGGNYGIAFSILDIPGYALKIGFKSSSFHPAIEEFAKTRTSKKDFSSMGFKDAHDSHANVLSLEEMEDGAFHEWAQRHSMSAAISGKMFVQVTEMVEQSNQFFLKAFILSNFISVESKRIAMMHDIWEMGGKTPQQKQNLKNARKVLSEKIEKLMHLILRYGRTDPIERILRQIKPHGFARYSANNLYELIVKEISSMTIKDPNFQVDKEINEIFDDWAYDPDRFRSECNDLSKLFFHGSDVHPGNIGIRKNQGRIVGFDHLISEARSKKRNFAGQFSKLFIQDFQHAKTNPKNAKIISASKKTEFEFFDIGTTLVSDMEKVISHGEFLCHAYVHRIPISGHIPLRLIHIFGDLHLLNNAPKGFQFSDKKYNYIVIFANVNADINLEYHERFSVFQHELEHLFHAMSKKRKEYFSLSSKNSKSFAGIDPKSLASMDKDEATFLLSILKNFIALFRDFFSPTEILAYTKQMYSDATKSNVRHRKPLLASIIKKSAYISELLYARLKQHNLLLNFDQVFSRCFASYEETVFSKYWNKVESDATKIVALIKSVSSSSSYMESLSSTLILPFIFSFIFYSFLMTAKKIYGYVDVVDKNGLKNRILRIDNIIARQAEKNAARKAISEIKSVEKDISYILSLVYPKCDFKSVLIEEKRKTNMKIKFLIKENENKQDEEIVCQNDQYKIVKLPSEMGELETQKLQKNVSIPQSVFDLGLRIYSVRDLKTNDPVAAIVRGPRFNHQGKEEEMKTKEGETRKEGIYDIILAPNIDGKAFACIGKFIDGHFFFRVDLRGRQIYHPTMAIQHSQFGQFIEGIISSFIGKATSPVFWSGKRYRYSGTIRDPNEKIDSPDFDEGERWG